MNMLAAVYIVAAFFLAYAARSIFELHRHSPLNRSCSALVLLFALISFVLAFFVSARTWTDARLLSKVSVFVSCFIGGFAFSFLVRLGDRNLGESSSRLIGLIYLPAAALAAYSLFDDLVFVDLYLTPWGWYNRPRPVPSAWDIAYYLYTVAGVLAGFIFLFRATKRIGVDGRVGRQNAAVLKFCVVGFLLVIVTDFFFTGAYSLFDIQSAGTVMLVSDLAQLALYLAWLCGLWYAMKRYKLFVIQPSGRAGDLLHSLDAPTILVDAAGRVLFANSRAMAGIPGLAGAIDAEDERGAVALRSIFEDHEAIEKSLGELSRGGMRHIFVKASANAGEGSEGGPVFQVYANPVINEAGEYLGGLLLVNPAAGYARLRDEFMCTERELEIIQLLDGGQSVRSIAEKLFISEFTVKTHIHNIYRKTGVSGRVGLSHILRG